MKSLLDPTKEPSVFASGNKDENNRSKSKLMSCTTDNCTDITGTYPSCFNGDIILNVPSYPTTSIIWEIRKGNGGSRTGLATTDGLGEFAITIPDDIEAEYFRHEGGVYTLHAWSESGMIPAEFTDATGGTLTFPCVRFCVTNTSVSTETSWDFEFNT